MDLNSYAAACNEMRNLCSLILHYKPFNAAELEAAANVTRGCVNRIAKLEHSPANAQPTYHLREMFASLPSAERSNSILSYAKSIDVSSIMWQAIDALINPGVVADLATQDDRLGLFMIINNEMINISRISDEVLACFYRIEHKM